MFLIMDKKNTTLVSDGIRQLQPSRNRKSLARKVAKHTEVLLEEKGIRVESIRVRWSQPMCQEHLDTVFHIALEGGPLGYRGPGLGCVGGLYERIYAHQHNAPDILADSLVGMIEGGLEEWRAEMLKPPGLRWQILGD